MRSIRLRTKFLLALLAITTGLTSGALLVVSSIVQSRVRESLGQELRTSVRTYKTFDHQRTESLLRSAQMMANLPNVRALMTTQDTATIQDGSEHILKLSGADLILFADRRGQIMGLQSKTRALQRDTAQALINRSFERGEPRDWWFTSGHLYQVLLQPIEFGQGAQSVTIGVLVVGHEIGMNASQAFGEVVGGEVAFTSQRSIVASTLPAAEQKALSDKLYTNWKLAGEETQELQLGPERYLASTVSLSRDANMPVSLTVLKSFDKATAFLKELNQVLVILGLVAVLFGCVIGFFLSNSITKPLQQLVSGVQALEKGDYSYPMPKASKDEVGVVTRAFGHLRASLQRVQQDQKELETRLRQAHKMEAVGRLAGGVAHDFNNLLTIIRGHSDLLADRVTSDEVQKKNVEQIRKASDRAVAMTRQLLAFSRMQVLQPRIVDLNAVIADMSKMLPRLIGEHIEYSFTPEPQLATVKADPGQMEQVLMNLAVNARDAMPNGGNLTVRTSNVTLSESDAAKRPAMSAGDYVLVSVSDTGHGMDEQTKAHIFEPFFTTKEVGKGTGLGLATVYGIVKQSEGFIWVESKIGEGTTFEIYFPQNSGRVTADDSESQSKQISRGTETILVAEDESGVRDLACEFLKSAGYTVLEASDGLEALEIAGRYSGKIHLLLTDIVMPRMGGETLVQRLRSLRPETKVLMMSGYAEYTGGKPQETNPRVAIMQKPFSLASLVAKVRQVIAEQPVRQEATASSSVDVA